MPWHQLPLPLPLDTQPNIQPCNHQILSTLQISNSAPPPPFPCSLARSAPPPFPCSLARSAPPPFPCSLARSGLLQLKQRVLGLQCLGHQGKRCFKALRHRIVQLQVPPFSLVKPSSSCSTAPQLHCSTFTPPPHFCASSSSYALVKFEFVLNKRAYVISFGK